MRRQPQLLPTLAILAGAGLLLAAVYDEVAPWLGMAGVVLLFAGGIWALRRSGVDRAQWPWVDGGVPGGDLPHGHHGGHHSGFDGGGGFFDGGGGGGGGGGHGGH